MAKSIAQQNHEKDVKVLSERLAAAAAEHDLCETFYEVMESINKDLIVPIPITKPGEVPVTGNIIVHISLGLRDAPIGEKDGNYTEVNPSKLEDIIDAVNKAVQSVIGAFPGIAVDDCYEDDTYIH